MDDIKINGKLTLGEDAADLGGTLLAYLAWKAAGKGQTLKSIDGFTPDQRFFIGMAQWACGSERPENLRVSAVTQIHIRPTNSASTAWFRTCRSFARLLPAPLVKPMVREKSCKIW